MDYLLFIVFCLVAFSVVRVIGAMFIFWVKKCWFSFKCFVWGVGYDLLRDDDADDL